MRSGPALFEDGAITLAQDILLHLAHGVGRQFARDHDPLRTLVIGEFLRRRRGDLVLARRSAGLRRHDRDDAFAEIGMTDDGPSSRIGITWTY